jgi:hypothetical protein
MDTGEDLAPSFDSDGNFLGMVKPNRDDMEVDEDLIENRELEVPVKPGTKTPTKPDKDSPYKPKPGPKKKPKARKGDMPDWLSFDEDLSENRELEVPVKPITKPPTKPDEDSPYKPKPGTKKKPKARKGDMPDWLSFDEIGINI